MSKIIVFGAGGRAGRRIVAESVRAGHEVTAVVRDPSKHAELAGPSVTVVAGDVTEVRDVASLSAGHDAAVSAVARMDVDATDFYTAAARALIAGLTEAGVDRVVLIGIGTTLTDGRGVAVHDAEGFPAEGRAFSLGHAAELEVFERDGAGLDWLVLAPPPVVLDEDAEASGEHRIGGSALIEDAAATFGYADLAAAVVAEIEAPTRSRVLAAVAN
jgi:putative NADH-flavin reductase